MRKNVLMAATALALLPFTASAQGFMGPETENRLFVNGSAEIEAVPDVVRFSVTSTGRGQDAKEADADLREIADEVRNALLDAGVDADDLTTSRVRLTPIYRYADNQPPKITGYESSLRLTVKSDAMEVAGAAMNAAVEAGATQVDGPYFEISDPNAVILEAKRKAMENAIDNAEALSDAGGFEIGNVITVQDSGQSHAPRAEMAVMKMMDASAAMETAPETAIDQGTQTVSANVSVVFEIDNGDFSTAYDEPIPYEKIRQLLKERHSFSPLEPIKDYEDHKHEFGKWSEDIKNDENKRPRRVRTGVDVRSPDEAAE